MTRRAAATTLAFALALHLLPQPGRAALPEGMSKGDPVVKYTEKGEEKQHQIEQAGSGWYDVLDTTTGVIERVTLSDLRFGKPGDEKSLSAWRLSQTKEVLVDSKVNKKLPANVVIVGYDGVSNFKKNVKSAHKLVEKNLDAMKKGTVKLIVLSGTHGVSGSGNPNSEICKDEKFTKEHFEKDSYLSDYTLYFGQFTKDAIRVLDFHEFKQKTMKLDEKVTYLFLFDWCFSALFAKELGGFTSEELSKTGKTDDIGGCCIN